MTRAPHLAALAAALSAGLAVPALADIIEIDPFEGDASESFEFAPPGFHAELDIFFTDPTIVSEPNGQMIPAFVTSFSSFMGSTIVAHEGGLFSHMTGPVDFVFFQPIQQFGSHVATNSGADGGTVEFFDDLDNLIGTVPLDVTFAPGTAEYTWNGWHSDIAFSRVRVSSNGTLQGFLGFDSMEMSVLPGPGAVILLLVAGVVGPSARQRRGVL